MKGTKILVVDPESEYKDLCFNLGLGSGWINAVGGSTGRINPLQVRPSPRDDEQEKEPDRLYRDEGYGMNDLALHMKNLEIFFSLYIPSLTDMQKAVLKKSLVELYRKFHITCFFNIVRNWLIVTPNSLLAELSVYAPCFHLSYTG